MTGNNAVSGELLSLLHANENSHVVSWHIDCSVLSLDGLFLLSFLHKFLHHVPV